ncbi:porphobilinogen synthase [Opitutales bacterium ASA1]|uniref:porphobilinogen synthase n=1 Tax=Congregicoccus parvus TaxID=3081749 RepID=UPI002B2AFDF8|nr:porphobilinogen synthase [Opitutales bacterium ASA1]
MSDTAPLDLVHRPRRLRRTPGVRALIRETHVRAEDLIAPLFVVDGEVPPEEIASMPGVFRRSIVDVVRECRELADLGVRAVALFPKLDAGLKRADGAHALDAESLILRTVRAVKAAVPEMLVVADIALDPYTTHGHDGVLTADGKDVDNDKTVAVLARMAVMHAEAGVDWVAPSDMMDGRVGAIRRALDAARHEGVAILAYSAKFNSGYYGPFREAVGSAQAAGTTLLGKQTYQLDPANRIEAVKDALLDETEGADVLMVKPAGPYLDVIRELRDATRLPIAAYQVSGEYAQIHAAARLGWLDLERCREESLLAIKRAGADMILSYFARDIAEARRAGR